MFVFEILGGLEIKCLMYWLYWLLVFSAFRVYEVVGFILLFIGIKNWLMALWFAGIMLGFCICFGGVRFVRRRS